MHADTRPEWSVRIQPTHQPHKKKEAAVPSNFITKKYLSSPLLRLLQQRLGHLVLLPHTSTPSRGFQLARSRLLHLLRLGRLLQPLGILRFDVLCLGILLVAVAETERVVLVSLRVRRYRGQRLPLLAA